MSRVALAYEWPVRTPLFFLATSHQIRHSQLQEVTRFPLIRLRAFLDNRLQFRTQLQEALQEDPHHPVVTKVQVLFLLLAILLLEQFLLSIRWEFLPSSQWVQEHLVTSRELVPILAIPTPEYTCHSTQRTLNQPSSPPMECYPELWLNQEFLE